MLLEIDIELEKMQVEENSVHPPYSKILGKFMCPLCSHNLHGHGWRKRYFVDVDLITLHIWIHRKYCPKCRTSYTLLPRWVHALKLYSVSLIKKVLKFKIEHDYFSAKFGAPKFLQKIWFKRLVHKARSFRDHYTKADLHKLVEDSVASLVVAPASVKVLLEHGNSRMSIQQLREPHQRLLLFLRQAPL